MDQKTLVTLEYPKILERLAAYAAFPASAEKARALQPTPVLEEARRRQAETAEALRLLSTNHDLTIGGARDVRAAVDLAAHGGVLAPTDLLDVKSTLVSARTLARTFERLGAAQYPNLVELAMQLPQPPGLVDAITRVLSERGEILDSASDKLANIRRDLRVTHDRLLTRLQRMVSDPKNSPYLQEALVTQRDGRYVLPLRAEFKGRIKAIVHDQSSSGATLFVEPLSVVEANNQYRELQLAERDEERRILAELSQAVGSHEMELQHMVDIIAELDLAFARAKYADDLRATMPVLHEVPHLPLPLPVGQGSRGAGGQGRRGEGEKEESVDEQPSNLQPANLPTVKHPGTVIRLYEARHPLLDPQTVVPVDVDLDPQTYALVITGPNTGGKTVTLKTTGLLALMAQAGLHIPAGPGSEISVFEEIYADIGDEQSIEQSLSTFSGHITNIIRILDQADSRSLVILDELGAGTDPQEGAALARALLTHLLARSITTLVTTHHPELKAFAHATPGVVNASVEFDLETLRPTYRLTIGLPGRSNALAIAQRLGMPRPIIDAARSELSPEDKRSWGLLDEIYRQRDASRQARATAEKARQEADDLRAELTERLEKLEDERREVLEKARQEAEAQVQELQEEIRKARQELARARQPLEALKAIEEQAETLEESVEKPVERRVPEMSGQPLRRAIRLGDKVRLRSLNTQGVVSGLSEEEAEVQVGVLRIRARLADLAPLAEEGRKTTDEGQKTRDEGRKMKGERRPAEVETPSSSVVRLSSDPAPSSSVLSPSSSVGMELDLRGQRADDALDAMERYLDSAYLAGMPFVRIIHGKGTGRLREAVRQALRQNTHVRSYEPGGEKEGGEGVTVVKL